MHRRSRRRQSGVAGDLTLSKVNQCPRGGTRRAARRDRESGMERRKREEEEEERERGREREQERENRLCWSPARVPFRQFFKIKSLSVLVKCISRTPKPPPPPSSTCRAPSARPPPALTPLPPSPPPPFLARAVDAAGRAFARAIVPLFPSPPSPPPPRRSTCCA